MTNADPKQSTEALVRGALSGQEATGTETKPAPSQSAPDSSAPDRSAPDSSAPDSSAPDSSAPDPSAPGRSAADDSALDGSAADTSAVDDAPATQQEPDETTDEATAEADAGDKVPPRLVRAELRKIFTTSTWWLFGIFTVLASALALLFNVVGANQDISNAEQARLHPPDFSRLPPSQRPTAQEQQQIIEDFNRATDIAGKIIEHTANIFTSGQYFGLMLVAIIGVLVVTNEFQHQTATTTFLATPQRTKVITAKLRAAVVLAAGYWLLATALGVGIGALNFGLRGYAIPWDNATVWRAVAMNLLAFTLWAMLGVGLGVLIRSQLGATITAAALYLISVPAAFAVFAGLAQLMRNDGVWNFIVAVPGVASQVMVSSETLQFGPGQSAVQWWVGALVLITYGVVAGVIGTLITRRRDIS